MTNLTEPILEPFSRYFMSDFFSQPKRIYFVPPPIGKEKKYFLKIKGNLDQALIGKVKNFLQKQGVDLNDPL